MEEMSRMEAEEIIKVQRCHLHQDLKKKETAVIMLGQEHSRQRGQLEQRP